MEKTKRTRLSGHQARRDFLKRTALGAGAMIAMPTFVSSHAMGLNGEIAANDRIQLGHIGVGNQGSHLFRSLQPCRGAQCIAISDCYRSRRDAYATAIQGKAYENFEELLSQPEIDAVVIATPDHTHVRAAIAAAKAGKDAYVEKPLGISIADDLECRRVFGESHRVFQYGTQQRSSNFITFGDKNQRLDNHCRYGCELVRSGKIGRVVKIEVVAPDGGVGGSTTPISVPDDLDFARWCGPIRNRPYTSDLCTPPGTYYVYDWSIGYLGGWGAHPLDIMVWGDDSDLSGPMTVEGTGTIPTEGLYSTVCHWDCTLRCANGVEIHFTPGGDSTKFIGEDGSWVAIGRSWIDANPKSLLDVEIAPSDFRLMDSRNHYQNFIDGVRGRFEGTSSLVHAVRSDIISHLCDITIREGRPIQWDPIQETILNDEAAAKRIKRVYTE